MPGYKHIALCVLIGISRVALASEPESPSSPDGLFELSLEELLQVKVTSATRTLRSLGEAPASITVFTRTELENLGLDFLYELISYVPGYQTGRDNDYNSSYFFSSRGSDVGQDTTAILLLVDGIPRQEIRTASASSLSGIMSLDRIERVEIMRGPGSALYGSGAFLGVINIVTVQGNNQFAVQMGEPDRQQLNGEFSQRFGKLQFDAFLSHYKDKGEEYQLDDRFTDTLQTTSDPQQISDYVLDFRYERTRFTIERMEISTQDFYSISTLNNEINEQNHVLRHFALEQTFGWLQVSSEFRISYQENILDYASQGTAVGQLAAISFPSSNEPLIGYVHDRTDETRLQWLNDWQVNEDNSVQFGAEHIRQALQESWVDTNFDIDALSRMDYPVAYSPDIDIYSEYLETQDRNVLGLYGQWQTRISSETQFTLGARYDNYQGLDDNVSLRLALVHQLSHDQYLKAFYGEAFRAPSMVQLAIKDNLTVARNPDLKAETIRSSELVWMIQKARYSFSASAFYNIIDDRIDSSGFVNGRRSNTNDDRDYSGGVELESSLQLSERWWVRLTYTDFLKLPESSSQLSDRLASFVVNYQQSNWWMNLSGYYNSQRDMLSPEYGVIDGFTMLNAKVGFKLKNDITANLQIKNLTNEDVASVPQSEAVFSPIPYRGRETSVGIRFSF